MFCENSIVKVLVPIAVGAGYDYRLTAPAGIGAFVRISVMNRPHIGVVIGPGDSGLPPEKIKNAEPADASNYSPLPESTLKWLFKMSEWTMMPPGAVLKLIVNVPEAFAPPKTETLYAFAPPDKIKITEQRQAVADAFASNDGKPMTARDIRSISRVSPAVVQAMIKSGMLWPSGGQTLSPEPAGEDYFDTGSITLSPEQQLAARAIKLDGFGVHLLDGITGSGKTQVYFDSAWRAYSEGRSVLMMMPEIALTAQFMNRFAQRFGEKPVVWHSNLTAARRRDIWRKVAAGRIRMVVGTRSALFLPWQNLGLIVVDEEHDGSYKQEEMGNYHARDMAVLRGSIENFPIILASATPSAETFRNAQSGKYKWLKLSSRFGGAALPLIETIDMRRERPEAY